MDANFGNGYETDFQQSQYYSERVEIPTQEFQNDPLQMLPDGLTEYPPSQRTFLYNHTIWTQESLNSPMASQVAMDPRTIIPPNSFANGQQLMSNMLQSSLDSSQLQQQHQQQSGSQAEGLPELFNLSDFIPCSQTSTTIASQEEVAVPSIEEWSGDLNFSIGFPPGTTRKFVFSTEKKKLYCLPSTGIVFLIRYNYDMCGLSKMALRCVLRYTDSQYAGTPVRRCDYHLKGEKKKSGESAGEKNDPAYHILKCDSPVRGKKPVYYKGEDSRFYVQVPLGKPQAGTDCISQVFKFDCSQTCKPDTGITRTGITAVMELLKDKKVVGRYPFELKVCSCPVRDFSKAEPDHPNGLENLSKRKAKSKSLDNNEAQEVCLPELSTGSKIPKKSKSLPPQQADESLDEMENIAKRRRISTIKSEAAPALEDSDSDLLFSSQESNNDEAVPQLPAERKAELRDCLKMAKFILKLRYVSKDRVENLLGTQLKGDIKRTYNTFLKQRQRNLLNSADHIGPSNGSPDSGLGPAP